MDRVKLGRGTRLRTEVKYTSFEVGKKIYEEARELVPGAFRNGDIEDKVVYLREMRMFDEWNIELPGCPPRAFPAASVESAFLVYVQQK